jgi:hypothetical protein
VRETSSAGFESGQQIFFERLLRIPWRLGAMAGELECHFETGSIMLYRA